LMFWTPRATEQAMFLAFGLSSDVASKAEALQRTYDSADSLARNLQWQATGRRRRLEALASVIEGQDPQEVEVLEEQHRALEGQLDQAGERLTDAEAARRSAGLA